MLAAALQATGSAAEAARERELATQLSSTYAEWAKRPTGSEPIPRGLERIKPSLEISTLRRIDNAIAATGQREQNELAAFHLDRGRRFFEQGNNTDAMTELSRAIYLAPYEARGAPAARPDLPADRPDAGGDRRVQDRAVEPGIGRRPNRARSRLSAHKGRSGGASGAGACARPRSRLAEAKEMLTKLKP